MVKRFVIYESSFQGKNINTFILWLCPRRHGLGHGEKDSKNYLCHLGFVENVQICHNRSFKPRRHDACHNRDVYVMVKRRSTIDHLDGEVCALVKMFLSLYKVQVQESIRKSFVSKKFQRLVKTFLLLFKVQAKQTISMPQQEYLCFVDTVFIIAVR